MTPTTPAGGSLARAVAQFAESVQDMSETDLEREWAWGAYDSEGLRFALFRTYEELREVAVRLARERAARGPIISPAQRILAQYQAAYRDLEAALLGLPAGVEDQAPAEGEWPLRRILAHIVGAEAGFYVVVRYALERHRSRDDRPAEIPDEAWGPILGHELDRVDAILAGPVAGIRAFQRPLNERVLRDFAEISDEELAAPSTYWEGYEMSLRFRLHRFDSHLRQHTIQVDKTLHALGYPPGEAKNILRLIYAALAEAEGPTIGAWEMGKELRQAVAEVVGARAQEIAGILA